MKKSELRQIIREELLKEMDSTALEAYWDEVIEKVGRISADKPFLKSLRTKYRKYVEQNFKDGTSSTGVAMKLLKRP